jgi:hypothetical protein
MKALALIAGCVDVIPGIVGFENEALMQETCSLESFTCVLLKAGALAIKALKKDCVQGSRDKLSKTRGEGDGVAIPAELATSFDVEIEVVT